MSAGLSILRRRVCAENTEDEVVRSEAGTVQEHSWNVGRFAEEQIRGLARRVFLQGWPRPARQVVFSPATPQSDTATICLKVAEALAAEGAGRVSLIEADLRSQTLEKSFSDTSDKFHEPPEAVGSLRKCARQLSPNLWFISSAAFVRCEENEFNAAWLCSRLGELRREFDFSVIHASATTGSGNATFMAHLCDGLVLVLDPHRTRRMNALRIREQILAANAKLLGIVLCDRDFPIPEKLYRKL